MFEFFARLFDTKGFPRRWECGAAWESEPWLGWLHIGSDVATWLAYTAIPVVLGMFLHKRRDLPFPRLFWCFMGFIFACGTVHLVEAVLFAYPIYRFSGLMKLVTAVVSWATVIALIPAVPRVGRLRSPEELEKEVEQRTEELASAHRLLDSVINGVPDAIFVKDLEGRYQMINRAGAAWLRLSVEEVVGCRDSELFTDTDLDDIQKVDHEVIAEKCALTKEERIVYRDQQLRMVLTTKAPLFDPEGNVVGLFGIGRDLTEQRKAEEALRDREERLRAALSAADVGTWRVDLKTLMDTRDANLNRLLGYPESETTQSVEEFFAHIHPDDRGMVDRIWRDALETSGEYDIVHRIYRVDGEVRWIRDQGQIVTDPEGQPKYATGAVVDITERKQVEEELRLLNQSLEERVRERTAKLESANQELESFSYSVSHDLRAPQRHISGFVDLFKKNCTNELSELAWRYLSHIEGAAKRSGQLIDALLEFSRMSRSSMRIQPVDADLLVREIVAEMSPEWQGRQIDWRIDVLPSVAADRELLRLVFQNLLSNAIKYTSRRDKAIIEIRGEVSEEKVTFAVKDNGVGFDMQYASLLFGVFQRLHREDEFEGLGIGLATVQRIVLRHGGQVWAESQLDMGTEVLFCLPRTIDDGKA